MLMPANLLHLFLAGAAMQPAAPAAPPACTVDRTAMLALGMNAFDQDMEGGWRILARRPECREAAADLIRDYRQFVEGRLFLLRWHEAQMRAFAGKQAEAVPLFDRARRDPDTYGWNHYVDATIAFLRGDRAALAAARARLAASPIPDAGPGEPRLTQPMFLDVVDGLLRCFGRPYLEIFESPRCQQAAA